MKTTLLIPLLALACATSLRAQTVAGTELEIGPSGSNQVTGAKSGAIGLNNQVAGNQSFAVGGANLLNGEGGMAVGTSNYSHSSSIDSFVLGNANEIRPDSTFASAFGAANLVRAYCGFAFGEANIAESYCGGIIGSFNVMKLDAAEQYLPESSLMIGNSNFAEGLMVCSLVCGMNNVADAVWYSTTLGEGLVNKWNRSTVLGGYNDSSMAANSGLLFAIGNGVDATHRSNALEVYSDGKIKMPRQGDILMGEFGNGD